MCVLDNINSICTMNHACMGTDVEELAMYMHAWPIIQVGEVNSKYVVKKSMLLGERGVIWGSGENESKRERDLMVGMVSVMILHPLG